MSDLFKITFSIKKESKNIFLFPNNGDYIDCHNIHMQIYNEIQNNTDYQEYQDITEQDLLQYECFIFLNSQLLLGGSESPISSQEYFFGLLDSKNSDTLLDTLKPIYYFAPKDESSGLGKLSIFYHSSTLTLLNYSIIDSSLNIKLECNSKESQKLLSNALSLKEKEYQSKTIQAQQSIATLHSLLENQEVKCIHGGKVILKSNKGKTFKSDGIPLILESDLLGSKISGCPRSVGGVSDPCTQVVNVKASLSQKKINGEYAILQELIGGCLTDKGFPLEVSFVPSKIKFDHSYDPKIGLTKQSLTTSQSFNLPILRLYYKEHNYQIDNTLIQRYTLNNTLYELKEESNPQFFKEVIFEEKDLMDLSKSIENTKDIAPYQDKIILFDSLKQEFQKYYEFKEVTLNLGIHTFFLIFVIPKRIPKIYQKDYKALDSQRKDYGIGYFKELLEYNKDYKETNTQNNPYTPFLLYHTRVFLAPAKAKKIHFEFALGLDNYIESKDKESNTNVCKFKVLSGDVIEEREEVEGGEKEKGIISLHFNGKLLTIIVNKDDKEIERISFQAVSGSPQEKSNGKHYFTYEKERQMLKNEGPIPEGEYYIDINKISEVPTYRLDRQYSWGVKNVPIELNNQETYGRYGFYIHGSWSAGSAGCIDLWDKNEMFFDKLIKLSKKFNVNRIPLVVEYKDLIMECSKNLLGLIKRCESK